MARLFFGKAVSVTSKETVKNQRNGAATVSSKNQITIPVHARRTAGLKPGSRVVAQADSPGRVVLVRETDPLDEFSGTPTGHFRANELDELRDEWR